MKNNEHVPSDKTLATIAKIMNINSSKKLTAMKEQCQNAMDKNMERQGANAKEKDALLNEAKELNSAEKGGFSRNRERILEIKGKKAHKRSEQQGMGGSDGKLPLWLPPRSKDSEGDEQYIAGPQPKQGDDGIYRWENGSEAKPWFPSVPVLDSNGKPVMLVDGLVTKLIAEHDALYDAYGDMMAMDRAIGARLNQIESSKSAAKFGDVGKIADILNSMMDNIDKDDDAAE